MAKSINHLATADSLFFGKGALDHPIQQEEVDRETGYNTYKINGLPPTPIANPGRAAIEAVLRPAKTKDLYFVADGTGAHAFAENLEQHQKNVARLRQFEQQQREASRPPADSGAPGTANAYAPPGAAPDFPVRARCRASDSA